MNFLTYIKVLASILKIKEVAIHVSYYIGNTNKYHNLIFCFQLK
jgi:hypothetical protein